MDAELATERQREKFEAVRRRVFDEMRYATSRWRIALMLPFQILVVTVLAVRGEPPLRLAVQIGASVLFTSAITASERGSSRRAAALVGLASAAMLVGIANTGGLASPLLVSAAPFLLGVGLNPEIAVQRRRILGAIVLAFAVMAILSHTALGELGGPLAPDLRWASAEYVTLALASAGLACIAIYHISKGVTAAYERIALELAERREELCDESEGRTRALEGIAARLAHEVKNPLAAIKGLSTHVARSATDPKVKERLSIVAAEAERLQEIVDGFLSFSRGLDELQLGSTKPYEMSRELALLLETRAADAGVSLEVRGSRELVLNADGKKLRQALLNLVLNAMQASERGSTVTVEVAKSCADGAAVLRVIDRGVGMTPEVLDRIRKPYFTTKEGGSGLGIAVARGIIEQHGGTLQLESAPGRGTTATMKLPACARKAQDERTALPHVAHGPCRVARAFGAAVSSCEGRDASGAKDGGDAPREPGAEAPLLASVAPDEVAP